MPQALLLAILTGRALAIDWPSHQVGMLTPRLDNEGALALARRAGAHEVEHVHWLNANRVKLQAWAEGHDLNRTWSKRLIRLQSNRGFSQGLLASARHAAVLEERGLDGRSAQFGCLFNFLLRPTREAIALVAPLVDAMESAHSAGNAIVGIHVRTGDTSFATPSTGPPDGGSREAELFRAHAFIFDYARQLGHNLTASAAAANREGASALGGQARRAARYVILGDSAMLRQRAAAELGEHSVLYYGNGSAVLGHVARERGALTLQSAIAEHWVYAGCDAFVYSSHSGFPRTAASRAMRDDRIHTCFHYDGPLFAVQQHGQQRPRRECSGPWSVTALGDRHAAGL
jgi:hypothetical protein